MLRQAVETRIEGWDHPSIDMRDEAGGELGLMLQEVVRAASPTVIPSSSSLDGLLELAASLMGESRLNVLGAFYLLGRNRDSMLPVEAELDVSIGAASTIRVGAGSSIFPMPRSDRQFARQMQEVEWQHEVRLTLAPSSVV